MGDIFKDSYTRLERSFTGFSVVVIAKATGRVMIAVQRDHKYGEFSSKLLKNMDSFQKDICEGVLKSVSTCLPVGASIRVVNIEAYYTSLFDNKVETVLEIEGEDEYNNHNKIARSVLEFVLVKGDLFDLE